MAVAQAKATGSRSTSSCSMPRPWPRCPNTNCLPGWDHGSSGSGNRRRRGLRLVGAQIHHRAAPAFGLARLADVAAVQDQPVMRAAAEWLRDGLFQLQLDLKRSPAGREAGAVADAEDV